MKKHSVLIVEDNADMREPCAEAFKAAGFDVYTADNGEDGLRLALEHHPDVILMDIMMPKMNGHMAVSKLRRDPWGKNAKVIYLTNMTDAENVVHAVEQGSEEYIIKAHTSLKDIVNKTRTVMFT